MAEESNSQLHKDRNKVLVKFADHSFSSALDEINSELPECDVALVIGANDTVNPVARSGEGPLGGMPIIDADKARVVVIIKRSLSVGYAGVDNDLFCENKTMMLFGDGKKMMNELNAAFKDL